jgi:hypothetical protein
MWPERRAAAIGALLTLLGVSGCATLDEAECRSVDWFQLGARDGANGYGRSRLSEHRDACAEHGLEVDAATWEQGYDAGLLDYCTADTGYRIGRRGLHYGQVCPIDTEREFLAAYEIGRETYGVEQEIAELDRRIESLEQRLRSDKIDDATRTETRRQLHYLYNQGGWLRRSLDRLDREWRRSRAPY